MLKGSFLHLKKMALVSKKGRFHRSFCLPFYFLRFFFILLFAPPDKTKCAISSSNLRHFIV